ncbi:MAG: ribonuclease HII [Parcubacteria group bacterium]
MLYSNFQEEKILWRRGYKRVAGLDEAGRGPLAGPVVAAAVVFNNSKIKNQKSRLQFKSKKLLREVDDSKKLSAKKRGELYGLITKNKNIKWGIGIVSEKVIDKINIKNAAELAMEKAIDNLKCKNQKSKWRPDFLIIDGNGVKNLKLKSYSLKLIVGGDGKVFSVAAASILAKVARDRIMMRYHKKYPKYRFDLHKGYGTKLHTKLLKKHGPCKIHRKSFAPVRHH